MAARSSLTILFENPFWIGLYERIDGDKYEVCKITFGAEPKAESKEKSKKNGNMLYGKKRKKLSTREGNIFMNGYDVLFVGAKLVTGLEKILF